MSTHGIYDAERLEAAARISYEALLAVNSGEDRLTVADLISQALAEMSRSGVRTPKPMCADAGKRNNT